MRMRSVAPHSVFSVVRDLTDHHADIVNKPWQINQKVLLESIPVKFQIEEVQPFFFSHKEPTWTELAVYLLVHIWRGEQQLEAYP